MSAICGILQNGSTELPSLQQLRVMRDVMFHRGPEAATHLIDSGVAFGGRSSCRDLPRAAQKLSGAWEGRYHVSLDGALYNRRELRAFLESHGSACPDADDAELVGRLYEHSGPQMVESLDGVFALAIFDRERRTLFMARDRLGVKPLCYAEYRGTFYFGSEIKSLVAAGVPASFDRDAWAELLCFGHVAGERTPFVGIRRLLPGHSLLWSDGKFTLRQWWHLGHRARALREGWQARIGQVEAWFWEALENAVDRHRLNHDEVGVLLGGGIDSVALAAALTTRGGTGAHAFGAQFGEPDDEELRRARAFADACGMRWNKFTLMSEELIDRISEASWLNDEPLAGPADIHLLGVARSARRRVSMLLSSEGADETLGGHRRYRPLRHTFVLKQARAVLPWMPSAIGGGIGVRRLSGLLALTRVSDFVLFNACRVLPLELQEIGVMAVEKFPFRDRMVGEAETVYPNDPMRQAMYVDQHTGLPSLLDRIDRMNMAAALECGMPFLDCQLVEGLAALPTSTLCGRNGPNRLVRRALAGRLPQQMLNRRLWRSRIPWSNYLRQVPAMRAFLEMLPDHHLMREGPFRRDGVRDVVGRFLRGDQIVDPLVEQMFAVVVWHDTCCQSSSARRRSVESAVATV